MSIRSGAIERSWSVGVMMAFWVARVKGIIWWRVVCSVRIVVPARILDSVCVVPFSRGGKVSFLTVVLCWIADLGWDRLFELGRVVISGIILTILKVVLSGGVSPSIGLMGICRVSGWFCLVGFCIEEGSAE